MTRVRGGVQERSVVGRQDGLCRGTSEGGEVGKGKVGGEAENQAIEHTELDQGSFS